MPSYMWDWKGKTTKSYDTEGKSLSGPIQDPFDFGTLTETAKYTVITSASQAFVEEYAKVGVRATITKIEPEVWIETTTETRQYRDWTFYTWHHWLHIKAKVYFESDKPLMGSPIFWEFVLIKIASAIIAGLVIAFAVYMFFEWMKSMVTETWEITYYDPETGLPAKTEKGTKPQPLGTIIIVVGALAGLAILASALIGKEGKGKRRR